MTLTFASSILATPAMYVYRNGYNGTDLKSAVSALIRHGRSNRPTYGLASWRNGRRMRLKIPGHMTCEFKSRRGYFATLAEWHTRQAQTLFFLSSTLRSSITLLLWRNSYERNVLTETNHKTRNAGILRNTHRGYVNRKGNKVGYYRTTGVGRKRYIEDWCADKAQKL